jgi:hypothetical protein
MLLDTPSFLAVAGVLAAMIRPRYAIPRSATEPWRATMLGGLSYLRHTADARWLTAGLSSLKRVSPRHPACCVMPATPDTTIGPTASAMQHRKTATNHAARNGQRRAITAGAGRTYACPSLQVSREVFSAWFTRRGSACLRRCTPDKCEGPVETIGVPRVPAMATATPITAWGGVHAELPTTRAACSITAAAKAASIGCTRGS